MSHYTTLLYWYQLCILYKSVYIGTNIFGGFVSFYIGTNIL